MSQTQIGLCAKAVSLCVCMAYTATVASDVVFYKSMITRTKGSKRTMAAFAADAGQDPDESSGAYAIKPN